MGLYDVTINDIIHKNALIYTDEVGFVCEETQWTFGQYSHQVDYLASGLASLGICKGDRIAVLAFNCHEYLLLFGAAARLGAIMVPINWRLKSGEIKVILEACTPIVMVSGPEYMGLASQILDRCPFVVHRLAFGEGVKGFRSMGEVARLKGHLDEADLSQHDPFVIIHTAAVEGRPKGAVLTHGNFVMASIQAIALMGIRSYAVYLNFLPFFHIGGLGIAFRTMYAGGRNVIMRKFDAEEAVDLIKQQQVTVIDTFPPILSNILDQAGSSGQSLSSLKNVIGLENQKIIQRYQRMTEGHFWVGFGQTETTGFCTTCPFDERPGSSGKESPLVQVRIVDDYDKVVPAGQVGEIVVRGSLVFQKYWNMEKETAYTLREGWHHTGDIGQLDQKGYLWYMKRKAEKELIKPGGENVYPAEVETALIQHPDVLEACVFGIPDKQWGEAVKAICVRKEGSLLKPQALIDFVAERIARYKKPKYVTFVSSLPKSKDGSICQDKLKNLTTKKYPPAHNTNPF